MPTHLSIKGRNQSMCKAWKESFWLCWKGLNNIITWKKMACRTKKIAYFWAFGYLHAIGSSKKLKTENKICRKISVLTTNQF